MLDSKKLPEMKQPRCGNADLVHVDVATILGSIAHCTFFQANHDVKTIKGS